MCDFLKTPCNSPLYGCSTIWASQVALVVKNPRVIARGEDWIPGRGRSPGDRNRNPLQYSCLENSINGEAW